MIPKAGLPPNWWQLTQDTQNAENGLGGGTGNGGGGAGLGESSRAGPPPMTEPRQDNKLHYLKVAPNMGPGPAHI